MQITIVVEDKIVICGNVAVSLPDADWSVFDGDPSTKWDDVAAVQFNTDTGQGHVEYRTIITSSPMRPNIRPGDMPIDAAHFEANYAWILQPYAIAREAQEKREREAAEAAKRAALEASENAVAAYRASKAGVPVEAAPLEDVDTLKAELEKLRKQVDAQQESFRRLDQITGTGDESQR